MKEDTIRRETVEKGKIKCEGECGKHDATFVRMQKHEIRARHEEMTGRAQCDTRGFSSFPQFVWRVETDGYRVAPGDNPQKRKKAQENEGPQAGRTVGRQKRNVVGCDYRARTRTPSISLSLSLSRSPRGDVGGSGGEFTLVDRRSFGADHTRGGATGTRGPPRRRRRSQRQHGASR